MAVCLWKYVIFCFLFAKVAQASNSNSSETPMNYWVSFVKRIEPGQALPVSVYLAQLSEPVQLRFDLVDDEGSNLQEGQNFILEGNGDIHEIQFEINKNLTDRYPERAGYYSHPDAYVRVRATGGVQFDEYQAVWGKTKHVSYVVHTDNTDYEPGQTVKLVAFALSGTRVLNESWNIVIKQSWWPNDNILAEWKQTAGDPETGVFAAEVVIPANVSLGYYRIYASIDDDNQNGYFSHVGNNGLYIREFGDFELKVETPQFGLAPFNFETLSGTVYVINRRGEPVGPGMCSVVADMHDYMYSMSNENKSPSKLVKNYTIGANGRTEIIFTREEIQQLNTNSVYYRTGLNDTNSTSLNNTRVRFAVTVTNDASGTNVTAESYIHIGGSYPVMLLGFQETYKPGFPYVDYAASVLTNSSFDINITYSDESGQWKDLCQTRVDIDPDSYGKFTIREKLPLNSTAIKIEPSNGTGVHHIFKPFFSPSRTYLKLTQKTARVKVGRNVTIKARSNVPFKDLYVQVYAKDALRYTKKEELETQGKVRRITFEMTSDMDPVADVIAFFTTENGEVVADRLAVGLNPPKDNKISLQFSKEVVATGDEVKLTVKGKPYSKVYVAVSNMPEIQAHILPHEWGFKVSDLRGNGVRLFKNDWIYFDTRVENSYSLFQATKGCLITDALVPGEKNASQIFGPQHPTNVRVKREATQTPGSAENDNPLTGQTGERRFYQESWVWQMVKIGKSGRKVLKLTAPNKLDTWSAVAFAVHRKLGLSWTTVPAKIRTN